MTRFVIGLAACALATLACGWVEDDASKPIVAPEGTSARASRVVSLAPVATRFVVAIGASHLLVGVDEASAFETARLGPMAITDAEGAPTLAPDLVLAPADSALFALPGAQTDLGSAVVIEFEPHDLEDAFELCRSVGERLVGHVAASRFEAALGRPLAAVGGASFGKPRLRVLGLVALDPPVLAGGHSFETDLIEIAGGRSVTHGGESARRAATRGEIERLSPDLILVMTRDPAPESAIERLRARSGVQAPIETIAVDTDDMWTGGLVPQARALQTLLEGHAVDPLVPRPAAGAVVEPPRPPMVDFTESAAGGTSDDG